MRSHCSHLHPTINTFRFNFKMPAIAAVTLLPRDEDPPKPTHTIAKPKPTTPAADTEDEAPTTKITKVAKVTDDASESMGVKPTAAKTHLSTSAADSASTSGAFQDIKDVADGCVHGVTSEKCKSGPQWVVFSMGSRRWKSTTRQTGPDRAQ
jgi:hypothetical protein